VSSKRPTQTFKVAAILKPGLVQEYDVNGTQKLLRKIQELLWKGNSQITITTIESK